MKSIFAAVAVAGLMFAGSASASGLPATCGNCHKAGADAVGPSFKSIAAAYGDAKTLAGVFKAGFKVEDRKVASGAAKWKSQAGIMTGQFGPIKGNEDAVAAALFEAAK